MSPSDDAPDSGLDTATATRPAPIPGPLVDGLLLEIGSWLESPAEDAGADIGRRPPAARAALRRLIGAHGLGPFLAAAPVLTGLRANLPGEEAAWLNGQLEANRERIRRLHEELAAALAAMAGRGVRVMPLKGALLTTRAGADPAIRPMADLDLLVAPGDRAAATAALVGLGYLRRPDGNRRPTHDVFEGQDGGRVRSWDGEHPDNPRRIELHTEVRRHLWVWTDDDDLTEYLWSGARDGDVLGQPAAVPSDAGLLAHLAVHATCDLLVGRGRLIQWLDLAGLAGRMGRASGMGRGPAGLPHPRLVQPSLILAARRLPASMACLDLRSLDILVPAGLRRWTSSVSLDRACGLQSGRFLPGEASTAAARWERWAPRPWRLWVAHGDVPLGVASARHAVRLAGMTIRRPGG